MKIGGKSKTSLKIASINAGMLLDRRTRLFFEKMANGNSSPDVLLVQEFLFRDLPLLERWPHIAYSVQTNNMVSGERAIVGDLIASRYIITDTSYRITHNDGILRDVRGTDSFGGRYLRAKSDRQIEATENRSLVSVSIIKNDITYRIATTHAMWSRGGVPSRIQRANTRQLIKSLKEERSAYGSLVLAGDMNFNRGGEMYQMFAKEGFNDCVPSEVKTTLDPDHHLSHKGINVVSDYIFTIGNGYQVYDIRLKSGVSDHVGIFATILKK